MDDLHSCMESAEKEHIEDKMTTMSDYVRVLQENDIYRTLFIAYCIDNCGNWLTFVACISIITNEAGTLDTSFFLICRLLPSVLFAGILGPVADRYDKMTLLIVCSIGSAISVFLMMLLLPVASSYGNIAILPLIYSLTLIQFTFSALYEPVRNSLLPVVVSQADLIVATSLDGLAWSTVGAFGAMVGGFVNSWLGAKISFGLDILSYVVCACWLYSASRRRVRDDKTDHIEMQSTVYQGSEESDNDESKEQFIPKTDFLTALAYLYEHRFIFLLCLIKGGGSTIWGVSSIIAVKISEMSQFQTVGDDSITLGLIFACEGIGCQIGPLLWNCCTPQKERSLVFAVVVAFVQMGMSYVCLVLSRNIWGVFASTVLRAMGSAVVWIYSTLLLQRAVDGSLQGRVFAVEQALCVVCEIGSVIMGGVFFDGLGWDVKFTCEVMGLVGGGVCLFWVLVYAVRYHGGWAWTSEGRDGRETTYAAVAVKEDWEENS